MTNDCAMIHKDIGYCMSAEKIEHLINEKMLPTEIFEMSTVNHLKLQGRQSHSSSLC